MMRWNDALRDVAVTASGGAGEAQIEAVEYDSRRVRPGAAFVAMRGGSTDGNRFVDAAVAQGATAVVTDSGEVFERVRRERPGLAVAQVEHGRRALAVAARNFYNRPDERLSLTGITGTNGKTTTSYLIDSVLRAAGHITAVIGTIEYHLAGRVLPAVNTTPESLELIRLFAELEKLGGSHVTMEVSSHALEQGRVYGLHYDVAAFTNLTRDHLDYHRTIEAYSRSKQKLFEPNGAAQPRVAVINRDDPFGAVLNETARRSGSEIMSYGLGPGPNVNAQDIDYLAARSRFRLHIQGRSAACESRLVGEINVYNLLAASAATFARGCTLEQIRDAIASFNRVPGRFELVDCGQPFIVVVDYAHTDDALRNLTRIARQVRDRQQTRGRIITLFGCGGDRDRSKRPLMGRAAGEGSDFVVLTSDNPRSEDPQKIIADALPGLSQTGKVHAVEADRRKAIALAIAEARSGDIVLLAGKGHEKYQVTREGTFPFDDVQIAKENLASLGYRASVPEGAPVA